MLNDNTPDRTEDQLALRVGGIALGLLVGLLVGAALAILLIAVGSELAAGWVFFAVTAVGASLVAWVSHWGHSLRAAAHCVAQVVEH